MSLKLVKCVKDTTNKTSEIKEGRGGAETLKKKEITIIKDIIGIAHKIPRIITC